MRKRDLIPLILMIIGFICLCVAGIGQQIASLKAFGTPNIPFVVYTWTDWFFLGFIPISIGWTWLYFNTRGEE